MGFLVGQTAVINDAAIDSKHYVNGSIDTVHIDDAQITTAKIADSQITTVKIVDGAVTAAKTSGIPDDKTLRGMMLEIADVKGVAMNFLRDKLTHLTVIL